MLTPKLTEIRRGSAHAFAYVECDVPEDLTLRDWAAQRAHAKGPVRRRLRIAPRNNKILDG